MKVNGKEKNDVTEKGKKERKEDVMKVVLSINNY